MAIKVRVRTIWLGKVGIPDKYVNQARDTFEDLYFYKGNEYMIIPFNAIDSSIVGKTETPFRDKFRKDKLYYLIYFNWSPSTKQQVLFK